MVNDESTPKQIENQWTAEFNLILKAISHVAAQGGRRLRALLDISLFDSVSHIKPYIQKTFNFRI